MISFLCKEPYIVHELLWNICTYVHKRAHIRPFNSARCSILYYNIGEKTQ